MPSAAGIRRALDAQIDRALKHGPPTPVQEAAYVASWLGTLGLSWLLLRVLGPRLSRG
jgi:hypothetical protein